MKNAHYPKLVKIELLDLYISKYPNGCWHWIRTVPTTGGYCQVLPFGLNKVVYAHRWVYECLKDKIPLEHDLHHKCHDRACVNPDHLEPVHEKKHKMRFHSRRAHA